MIGKAIRQNSALWMLAFAWCLGLSFGVLSAASAGSVLIALVRRTVSAPVTICGLLIAIYTPFLLSALAAQYCQPAIYVLAIAKGFGFAFCAFGIWIAFHNAAWLISPLFLFSEWASCPVLYLFWMRHVCKKNCTVLFDFLACSVIVAAVIVTDYLFIYPWLLRVFV